MDDTVAIVAITAMLAGFTLPLALVALLVSAIIFAVSCD